jgi:hypothetical protein
MQCFSHVLAATAEYNTKIKNEKTVEEKEDIWGI